jgi:hypothetical protein
MMANRSRPYLTLSFLVITTIGLSSCSAVHWVSSLFSGSKAEVSQPSSEKEAGTPETEVSGDTKESPSGMQRPVAPAEGVQEGSNELSKAAVAPETAATEQEPPSVEILWQVPVEPVDKYYIYYGSDQNNLDKKAEVPVSQLEKIDHPVHGPLYRYVLTGIASNARVFFSIQAENQYGLSPKSPAQEIR